MLYMNDIPYLKTILKRQVTLPKDPKSINKFNVVFLNSINSTTIYTLFHKHPVITKPTNYTTYYINPIYKTKIGTKNININFRQERKTYYNQINQYKNTSGYDIGLTPVNTIELANSRNMVYDLFKFNQLYIENYTKGGNIKQKIESYIEYIANSINDTGLDRYKYKMMMIDIDDWFNTQNTMDTISTKAINPITYITYALYRYPDILSKIANLDIYIYSKEGILRLNTSNLDKNSYQLFKRELNKLLKKVNLDTIESIDENEVEEESEPVSDSKVNTGKTTAVIKRAEDVKQEYADDETLVTEIEPTDDESDIDDISDGLDLGTGELDDIPDPEPDNTTDEEFGEILSTMTDIKHSRRAPRSEASKIRDAELKKIQDDLVVDDITIKDCAVFTEKDKTIPEFDIGNKIKSTNDNIKTIKYANFDKSYNENLMRKDTINILTNLNNMSIPAFVKDIKIEDTSTELNYKETYTAVLEDSNRVRHTLKFDMPKFIDGSFMYLEGNKKIINKQLFMKPIVKTGPDEVQICSNYNKIFMRRLGRKMTSQLERFKKTISNDIKGVKIIYGDNLQANSSYKTILEYDELAKSIFSIKSKDIEIIFNQNEIKYRLGDKNIPDNNLCVGFYSDKTPILMDFKTETINGMDLITFIISNLGADAKSIYDESSAGASKFMYTSATIMAKHVPIVLLLGYCEGLTTVLKKAKVKYHFTDKRPTATDKEGVIQFADGYLVFDRYPFENSLLLNAMAYIPTRAYNYADFDEIDVYLDLFDQLYSARNLANAFDTFYEFMIDPITKEVLVGLGYPTDFVSVVLCANAMLVDNSYIAENNMNLYRIRSNEVVNALLYKEIANAYARYRATSENNTPVKISIPQNAVISALMKTQTVEDYSTLNPLYEATKTRIASPKGVSGMNLAQAYTIDKRGYDKSMIGLVGVSTAVDANVGISRHLTMEPNIISPRGFIDIKSDAEVSDVNLFTPAEMLTPMGVTRDDAPRVSMASKQSTHIVPIDKSSPVLISNGSEQTIQYYLSSDFIVTADEDGEVVEKDDKLGIVVVKYKSGNTRAIDINSRVVKNGASGFYVANKLNCNLNVGDKFKAKDIIAYEDRFFSEDSINGNRMNIGSLQKVAVMSAYSTYEDSAFITKKVSQDMGTSVIMMKDISVGKNSDVDFIVNVGDTVEVGDPLISFSTSYDDKRMNEFLRTISDEQGDDIRDLAKTHLKSKYGGVVEDIKIYSSVDLSELSPSLKTIVSNYYNKINKKRKLLNKYDKTDSVVKAGILINEPTDKIPTSADGKIKGKNVDGVLIEFYIKYNDVVGVGDKITFFSALKSIVGEVIEEGYEPYSEFRPDEEVSAFVGPSAILARMVPSTLMTIMANKVLVELKRKLKDIYDK